MTKYNLNFLNKLEKPFSEEFKKDEWVDAESESKFKVNLEKIIQRNKKYRDSKNKHL